MKKFILFFIFCFLPLVSSISTTMLPSYEGSETMIIEIQGNILQPIDKSDIVFKRAHVAVAVDYDIKRISDKYYLYAKVPSIPNNYTLFINDVATTLNGQNQIINFNQTFEVKNNLTDYSINPGFIITSNDFSISIYSNLDQQIAINSDFPEENSITLNPGINNIDFNIGQKPSGFYLASIGKYKVPIFITNSNTNNQENQISLEIKPQLFRETLKIGDPKIYQVSIKNNGIEKIEQIYFAYNENLFLINNESISLEVNGSINISISLINLTKDISEIIYLAKGSNTLGNISFQIKFTQNESQVTNSSNPEYYCSELGGKFCSALEVCSVSTIRTLDGSCCTSSCLLQEESSSSSWIVYLLILLALAIIIFIYSRYKKTKLPKPNGPLFPVKKSI